MESTVIVSALNSMLRFLRSQYRGALRMRQTWGYKGNWDPGFLLVLIQLLTRLVRLLGAAYLGRRVRMRGPQKCCIVILSYRRPYNIDLLVRSALRCDAVGEVIVHNNARHTQLGDWISVSDSRLSIVEHPKDVGHGIRWKLAAQSSFDWFLSIDDDVFLEAKQIAALFDHLVGNPAVPHGISGEVYQRQERPQPPLGPFEEQPYGPYHDYPFMVRVIRKDMDVDHLTMTYAFTRQHLQRAEEHLKLLGLTNMSELYNGDDLLLSFAGNGRPRIHDLGSFLQCTSVLIPGIAFCCSTANFRPERLRVHRLLSGQRLDSAR